MSIHQTVNDLSKIYRRGSGRHFHLLTTPCGNVELQAGVLGFAHLFRKGCIIHAHLFTQPEYLCKAALRRIAGFWEARPPVPVMAVLGGGAQDWFIGAWWYAPNRPKRSPRKGKIFSLEIRFY